MSNDYEGDLDHRVQKRLHKDPAYRNAQSSQEKAERENEIEQEEVAAIERERGQRSPWA